MTMMVILVAVALLLVVGAYWVFAAAGERESQESAEQRVGDIDFGESVDQLAGLRNLQDIRNPVTRHICYQFWGAGVDVSPRTANLLMIVLAAVVLLFLLISPLVGLAVALAIVLGGYLLLKQRVAARRRQIADQLPDFLEYMQRSLTAGNTLEEALQSAALESNEPIRSVFMSVARQVRHGASVEDTLVEAADVHNLRALHILAMAATVNRRFGGSMRRVIKSLIDAIRRQEAASRELKALTGETRFSAWVVAAIPIGIAVIFYLLNPGYYEPMLASTGGRITLAVAVGLQLLGIFIIWRMVASLRDAAL